MKMRKIFLLIIIVNIVCVSQDTKTLNLNADTLFTQHFNEFQSVSRERREELKEIIPILYRQKYNSQVPKLIKFINVNKNYGDISLRVLIQNRDPLFLEWLNKNGSTSEIHYDLWKDLNWYRHTVTDSATNFKYNREMLSVLIGFLKLKSDSVYWNNTLLLVNDIGTFDQVMTVNKIKNKHVSKDILLVMQTRYKSNFTDSLVVSELKSKQKYRVLNFLFEFGFKEFNRYDYLTFLYIFQKELKNENDIRLEDDIKNTQEILAMVISALEQKKIEKAPIGLLLDWPNGQGTK